MHYSEVMWNAIVARIVSRREYCRGHHREEETSKLCSGCRKVFHSGLHQPPADCVAHKTRGLVDIQFLHEPNPMRFSRFDTDTQKAVSTFPASGRHRANRRLLQKLKISPAQSMT